MPVQLNREVGGAYTISVLLVLVLIPIGTSSIVSAQDAERSPAAPTETIEEIVVYGDKSLTALRQAIFRAEENFFDLFSSLNDDDDFDIRCFYETPTGTHIRHHVCRANFVTAATSAAAVTFRTEGPRYPVYSRCFYFPVVRRAHKPLSSKRSSLEIGLWWTKDMTP